MVKERKPLNARLRSLGINMGKRELQSVELRQQGLIARCRWVRRKASPGYCEEHCVPGLGQVEREGVRKAGQVRPLSPHPALSLLLLSSRHKDRCFSQIRRSRRRSHTGICGRFLGLQSHGHHPLRTNSKSKPAAQERSPFSTRASPRTLGEPDTSLGTRKTARPGSLRRRMPSSPPHCVGGQATGAPATPQPHPVVFPPGGPSALRSRQSLRQGWHCRRPKPIPPVAPGTRSLNCSHSAGASAEHPELGHMKKTRLT